MRWAIIRRARARTAETVLVAAWESEIAVMRTRKSSHDPGLVPCHDCGAESSWHVNRCQGCGTVYDEHEQRFRARMYEALVLGD
ncbi:MAG: hypothetical protein ACFCVC_12180 [Acidimicrobiia bacterium]